ncbi:YtxH domain-containing protein [Cohnella sp. AR92]|uniref:YtxH domain-containing protein n=1 Tax=Cohnella sp. AR92 TaxID=648716 RepID=UPI000F8D9410|nr:YtxH domain-containing protein [Cohnella sp. AR92]RUS47790.1 YtxH domain-containing protein [Cohnella sp. AR92]
MSQTKGMVKGVMIGGAIGAAAALLLAPKSGQEMRKDIRSKYRKASDRTAQWVSDANAKTKELASQVGQHASELMDKTLSVVRTAKSEAEDAAKAIKEEVSSVSASRSDSERSS